MVYRQLQLASVLLGVFAACGEGAGAVSVALQLDALSCGGGADRLELSCGGTVQITVTGEAGATIENTCIDLGADPLQFSALGGVLEQELRLGRLPTDKPLRIELAIFAQQLAQCPGDDPGLSPLVSGDTGLVTLDQANAVVELGLRCQTVPSPGNSTCDSCQAQVGECLQQAGAASCQQILQGCFAGCADGQQVCAQCSLLNERCQEDPQMDPTGISLNCEGLAQACTEQCANGADTCVQECEQVETHCNATDQAIRSCQLAGESCLELCGEGGACLRLR